jgi:hypothetical protein
VLRFVKLRVPGRLCTHSPRVPGGARSEPRSIGKPKTMNLPRLAIGMPRWLSGSTSGEAEMTDCILRHQAASVGA